MKEDYLRLVDIDASIVEHGLVRRGITKPSRVWHIDKPTGKRTLLIDSSDEFSKANLEHQKVQNVEAKNVAPFF